MRLLNVPAIKRIRAAQGHSTGQVQVQHVEKTPPAQLYHGTASRFMASIEVQGLIPGSRHHVHLTESPETAMTVGKRYGQPVLLAVDVQGMRQAGSVLSGGQWRLACGVGTCGLLEDGRGQNSYMNGSVFLPWPDPDFSCPDECLSSGL